MANTYTRTLAETTAAMSLIPKPARVLAMDCVQRNFEPMRKQVEAWKGPNFQTKTRSSSLHAFVEGELDVPRHLARRVHDLYFNPQAEEFASRTTWSLSNAFTSAFKDLDSIPQGRKSLCHAGMPD